MAKRRKPVRAPFVVTFSTVSTVAVAAAAVAVLGGCSGKIEGVPGGSSGIITNPPPVPTTQTPTVCPETIPNLGDNCDTGGDKCSYPYPGAPCPPRIVFCKDSKWSSDGIATCNPPPPKCPDVEPEVGASCTHFGPTCAYKDACGDRPATAPSDRTYACQAGAWVRTSAPYKAECPTDKPTHGQPCGTCADAYPDTCDYGDCLGTPSIHAKCDPKTGTWSVAELSCNPPPPPQPGG